MSWVSAHWNSCQPMDPSDLDIEMKQTVIFPDFHFYLAHLSELLCSANSPACRAQHTPLFTTLQHAPCCKRFRAILQCLGIESVSRKVTPRLRHKLQWNQRIHSNPHFTFPSISSIICKEHSSFKVVLWKKEKMSQSLGCKHGSRCWKWREETIFERDGVKEFRNQMIQLCGCQCHQEWNKMARRRQWAQC